MFRKRTAAMILRLPVWPQLDEAVGAEADDVRAAFPASRISCFFILL